MKDITFTDLFNLAILELASRVEPKNHCWLTEKSEIINRKIMELATELSGQLPPLKTLHFTMGGAYPYSYELTRSLDLLQQSGLIKRENPSYERFAPTWTNDAEDYLVKTKDEVFSDNKDALDAFNRFVEGLETLQLEVAA